MLYKTITSIEKEVVRIAGNAGTHAEMMATTLTGRWRRYLPKEQKFIDVHQLQLCVRDDLHGLRGEIREIEQEHLKQLEDDRLERGVRDVSIPQLRSRLVGIQRLFDGAFGAGSSTEVFGDETVTIPRDPFPLARLGHIAHGRLIDPGFVVPASELEGVKVVPKALAKSFAAPLATLEAALAGLGEKLPATNASLAKKMEKLDDLKKQAGIAARFLVALYFLAGHPEIARRVRLSSHRSRDEVVFVEAAGIEVANDEPGVNTEEPPVPPEVSSVPEELAERVADQDAGKAAA